jgi:hypothetical protein
MQTRGFTDAFLISYENRDVTSILNCYPATVNSVFRTFVNVNLRPQSCRLIQTLNRALSLIQTLTRLEFFLSEGTLAIIRATRTECLIHVNFLQP